MKKKIKILRIITSLNPKFGGPPVAIIDSSKALQKNGFEVDIITSDEPNSKYVSEKNLKIMNLGPSFGNYNFNLKLLFWLHKNHYKYDKFIIHGIWQFNTLLSRIILKQGYFVFLHGQLDNFFSTEFLKKVKKKIYWILIEKYNLLHSKALLLTSELEKKRVKNTYVDTSNLKLEVVNYGIFKPNVNINDAKKDFCKKFPALKNKDFFVYMGRFHPKKGCDIIIKSIKKIKEEKHDICVLMIGPYNEYQKKLLKLTYELKLTENILWSDFLTKNLKWGALAKSKAMLLPSHGENFGVSIVESLSIRKPVIITNKVNIYPNIKKFEAGFISSCNTNSFSENIIKFMKLNKKNYTKMSTNAFNCFNKKFNLELNQKKLISVLKK